MVVAAGGKESKEPFAAAGSRSSGQEARQAGEEESSAQWPVRT
jgi:hypothetical protein